MEDDVPPDDEEPADEEPDVGDEPEEERSFLIDPHLFGSIQAFQNLQRAIAGIDFGILPAIELAREAMGNAVNLGEVQRIIRDQLASSIDFSEVSRLVAQNLDTATQRGTKELFEGIVRSIKLPALEQARETIASFQIPGIDEATRRSAEAIAAQFQDIISRAGTLDLSRITGGLEAWIPDNLRSLDDIDDLEIVATITLDEGIPLAWVPRTSLVEELVAVPDEAARSKVLLDHYEDVLDDCLSLCSEISHRWARECEECIRAYRSGFTAPAQSHAANIVDSVVMLLFGRRGRDLAKSRAQEDFDDLALRVIGESITIRPLVRAFAAWWPDEGTPPPDHFSRHATAHAVGNPGLFANLHFLVAIMLATSLTAQFWQDPGASVGLLPPKDSAGS